ncbi:MAG: helix-turn-helix domain-containing protein [Devosiaceae bacterium]|nr:helix-turn-helix domain-containing protein [Devosiaceae bacterium]
MYLIGELSKQTGVKIPTIRYYEEMGLIEKPHRTSGNQRQYEREGLERLSFIKHARDLGLSIEDIRELVDLSSSPEKSCKQAHEIAHHHLQFIKAKISKLRKLEKELKRIALLDDEGHVGKCKIIASLADHRLCKGEH